MNRVVLAFVLLVTTLGAAKSGFSQDALAEHKIRGLKGLATLAIVVRPNTPREIASLKEWGDLVEVSLRRDVPELTRSEVQSARAWLELSVVTTDVGGALELSLYRWTKIVDSGEEVFSKVWWDSRMVFGPISRESLKDSLDALLTGFAADYFRAKR